MRALRRAVLTGVVAAFTAGSAGAQEVSLSVVDSLARMGRADEARDILTRWVDAVDGQAPRLDVQRSIWLRGMLTVDPSQAAVDFQRLVVEFPGGAFTGQALHRLGQYAAARGDLTGAAGLFRTLVRDHPGSPARLAAMTWLDENAGAVARAEVDGNPLVGPEPEPEPEALDPPVETLEETPEERPEEQPVDTVPSVNLGKSAGYVVATDTVQEEQRLPPDTLGRERAAFGPVPRTVPDDVPSEPVETDPPVVTQPPVDTTTFDPDPTATESEPIPIESDPIPIETDPAPAESEAVPAEADPTPEEAVDDENGRFTVQLGAFASESRARSFMETVRGAGFEPRLVDIPESDLVRVRVGRFASPETATRLYDRIVARGFEAAVVADAIREVPRG